MDNSKLTQLLNMTRKQNKQIDDQNKKINKLLQLYDKTKSISLSNELDTLTNITHSYNKALKNNSDHIFTRQKSIIQTNLDLIASLQKDLTRSSDSTHLETTISTLNKNMEMFSKINAENYTETNYIHKLIEDTNNNSIKTFYTKQN